MTSFSELRATERRQDVDVLLLDRLEGIHQVLLGGGNVVEADSWSDGFLGAKVVRGKKGYSASVAGVQPCSSLQGVDSPVNSETGRALLNHVKIGARTVPGQACSVCTLSMGAGCATVSPRSSQPLATSFAQ